MKATRRQELKHNELADQLQQVYAYIQEKSQLITVVLVAAVVALAAAWYWRASSQARQAEGWQTMLILLATSKQQDPQVLDKMEQVATSYSDAQLKAMAWSQLGNRLAGEAAMAESPQTAQEYIKKAEAAFQAVLSQTPDQAYAVAIAQLGLGGIAADRGDFDAAKRYYETVGNNERLKGTPFPGQASDALTALEAARKMPPLAAASRPAETAVPSTQPANG
jgi:tetratricopeptide (TPR) repeat protein